MMLAAYMRGLRIWVGASIALLVSQSVLQAQIGKVNCQDQPCHVWPQWSLRDCLPCKHRNCPPLNQYYGYHPSTWRLWPGTKPNVEPPQRDLILNPPTESEDGKRPPGAPPVPAKEGTAPARAPGLGAPGSSKNLPDLSESGPALGNPAPERSGSPTSAAADAPK
jgi:hypothetical protein